MLNLTVKHNRAGAVLRQKLITCILCGGIKMKVCMLVKIINSNCDYEPYFKVIGIGCTKVFNSFFEAEKFIEEKRYLYNYREQLISAIR